jgi:hypothetical protein
MYMTQILDKLPKELKQLSNNYIPIVLYEVIYFTEEAIKQNFCHPTAKSTFLFDSIYDALKKCAQLIEKVSATDEELKILADYLDKLPYDACLANYSGFWFAGKLERNMYEEESYSYIVIKPKVLGRNSAKDGALFLNNNVDECFIYSAALIGSFYGKKKREKPIFQILEKMDQGKLVHDNEDEDENDEEDDG